MENMIVHCLCDISINLESGVENLIPVITSIDNNFSNITRLPITHIPEDIRSNDPYLRKQPIYEISSKKIVKSASS